MSLGLPTTRLIAQQLVYANNYSSTLLAVCEGNIAVLEISSILGHKEEQLLRLETRFIS